MADTNLKGKTVDEVLATLNDEQKKAVAIFVSLAIEKELQSLKFEPDDDEEED